MNELLKVDFEEQTVSARDLYASLSETDGVSGLKGSVLMDLTINLKKEWHK